MAKINQKHMHPKFSGDAKFTLSRADFLAGDKKAYFGAGQAPDGMPGMAGYRKPLKWNKENTALRVPQMVWLTEAFIDASVPSSGDYFDIIPNYKLMRDRENGGEPDLAPPGPIYRCGTAFTFPRIYTWNDGHTETWEGTWTPGEAPYIVDSGGFSGSIYGPDAGRIGRQPAGYPGYQREVINWSYSEYQRLKPIFAQVKVTIESLRKGKTYVDIVDHNDADHWPNDRFQNGAISFPGDQRLGFMAAPDPAEDFFGTNFLHIYTGVFSQYEYAAGDIQTYAAPARASLSDEFYLAGRARVVGSYPKFAGFNVYLYGVGTLGQQPLWDPADQITVLPAPSCEGFTPFGLEVLFTSPNLSLAGPTGLDYINFVRNLDVDNFNNVISTIGPTFATYFPQVADDLSHYGYHYGGDSSVITATSLVRLIASNFGFDPVTGDDL